MLAAHRPRRPYPIASTTKLMTALVAERALPLSREVVAPPYRASGPESLLGLRAGERIEVGDLLRGLLLASGNDAAVALADAVAGSVPAFVRRMNRTARRLGLRQTHYANPIGLDQEGNYSSAADLTELAARLRRKPFFRRLFDTPQAVLRSGAQPRTVVNRNQLVRSVPWVDGVKTGYTLGAGNVLVGSGTRRGVTLISAVLGAPSEAARDAGTLALLEYGFSRYRRVDPVRRGEEMAAVSIRDRDVAVPLIARSGSRHTVRRGDEVAVEVDAPGEVDGPVQRGERLGTAIVTVAGEPRDRVALVAARSAAAASIGDRIDAALPGPRIVAWLLVSAALAVVLIAAARLVSVRRAARRRA